MSFRKVIDDITRMYPVASNDELNKVLLGAIEDALPEAVRTIKLPVTRSPFEIGSREFVAERMRKGARRASKDRTLEQDKIISEVARLQLLLDGTSAPSLPETYSISTDVTLPREELPAQPSRILGKKPSGADGAPLGPETDIDLPSKKQPDTQKNFELVPPTSSPQIEEVETKKILIPNLMINPEFDEQLAASKAMISFLMTVEVSLRRFASNYKLAWDFKLGMPSDVEDPDWRRVVLSIHPSKMKFDDSVKVWDRLDDAIRHDIKASIEHAEATQAGALRELNRNFFVELDLV